ncbi:unnamed protein product [Ceutorhynchus assimilis]|uniref:MADF domain-containing protein n=1 Tax=Ceutorhynchus assimilis TaxID=467358 RepID=A0A9N9MAA5_9CUCU|nr:unnamed protein product [Ceutorhynchus assimilis]
MNKDLLISEVYRNPPIWDQRLKSHYNRYVMDKCWAAVATNCKVTAAAARKTWTILRKQFKRHFDKLPVSRSGGEPPENNVKWQYFKSLLFLKEIFEKRPATVNLSDADNDISVAPTPSSFTSSAGCSSEATSHIPSSSIKVLLDARRADNLGYRKHSRRIQIVGKNLMGIEKGQIEMIKAKVVSNTDLNDEDAAFFASLLPHIKKLSPAKKLEFRTRIQRLVVESVYKVKIE